MVLGSHLTLCPRVSVSLHKQQSSQALYKLACVSESKNKQKDFIYIIDICESEGNLHLVEMNPFSGADLYCCDAEQIIKEIEKA